MGLRDSKAITTAAVKFKDKVYTLPRPARHHDIIKHICEEEKIDSIGENEQGFLDDQGRFLRRKPAKLIAQMAGQILENDAPVLSELYSENLW